MSPVIAQETTRLQIEVTRDGGFVARPELKVTPGGEGRLELGDFVPGAALNGFRANPALKGLRETVTITPTVRGDDIALAFTITSRDRELRPSLTISKDIRGSFEWVAGDGRPVKVTVAWVQ